MNVSQKAESSRVYTLDVHGTNKQNTCAPTTQFKKKEIVKLWKPSIHRREEPRSWTWCQPLAIFFFFFNLTAKSVTEIKLGHTRTQNLWNPGLRSVRRVDASPPAASPPSADTGALREDSFPGRKGRPLALFAYPPGSARRTSLKL